MRRSIEMKRIVRRIREKTNKFPYRTINTWKQCFKAFDFILSELQSITEDIDKGKDTILYSRILNEAIDLDRYSQTSKNIAKRTNKVAEVTSLVNNFLANETINIPHNNNHGINIEGCVDFVDGLTSEVEGIMNGYNQNKKITMPSIKGWVKGYLQGVIFFNSSIDAWNTKFQTQVEGARLLEAVENTQESFKYTKNRFRENEVKVGDSTIRIGLKVIFGRDGKYWTGKITDIYTMNRKEFYEVLDAVADTGRSVCFSLI
jgi:hypothetical protein